MCENNNCACTVKPPLSGHLYSQTNGPDKWVSFYLPVDGSVGKAWFPNICLDNLDNWGFFVVNV